MAAYRSIPSKPSAKSAADDDDDDYSDDGAIAAKVAADSKKWIHLILISIAVLTVTVYLLAYTIANSNAAATPQTSSNTMAATVEISKSVNSFAGDLLEQVHKAAPANTNIILSPFSVQTALGLAMLGATDATYAQLLAGLKLSAVASSAGASEADQRTAIANAFHALLAPLENNPMLKVANKIYVQSDFHIRAAFGQLAKDKFASETQTLNFGDAAPSAAAINAWVESKTNNLIKDLIKADSLSVDTRMVLVNAIYFKGFWKHQFPVANTHKAPFYTSETDSTDVDMMHVTEHFQYGEWPELDAKAIELPYKDSDMAMLIVLPNQKTGLAELVRKMRDQDLSALSKNMFRTEVQVSLPKFKIEYEVSLPEVLRKMGMTNMFEDVATFNELLEESVPLKISDVVHKAFIEVNEEGAEAAAATGISMVTFSLPAPPQQFVADHGFQLYLTKQRSIIFAGSFVQL